MSINKSMMKSMTDKYGKKQGKSVYYAVEAKLKAKGMSTKHKPKKKKK